MNKITEFELKARNGETIKVEIFENDERYFKHEKENSNLKVYSIKTSRDINVRSGDLIYGAPVERDRSLFKYHAGGVILVWDK